jgi:hypothetical protein
MALAGKHQMLSREFLRKAVQHYDEHLRLENKPSRKHLSKEHRQQISEAHSILTKRFWAKLSPEERSARAKKAAEARWKHEKAQKKESNT